MPFRNTFFNRSYQAVIFTSILLSCNAVSAQNTKPHKNEHFTPGSDISVGLVGQMTFARTPTSVTPAPNGTTTQQNVQSESPSAGAMFTYHKAFKPYVGYKINFSYTRLTQIDSFGSTFTPSQGSPSEITNVFGAGSFNSNLFEFSATYAFDGPRSDHFRSFGQVGAGEVVFNPIQPAQFHELKCAATVVFGAGGEYDLNRHFSLRAEYRGLLYRMPNFPGAYYYPGHRLYTVTNLPSISLVYHFGSSSALKKAAKKQFGPY